MSSTPNLNQLGPYTSYADNSLVEIAGPNNTVFGYQYDQETRTFFTKEVSLVYAGKHGITHITTDPIPTATCASPGLLAADDKCRLDNLVGTRIGVLGFQGSGFPDDGGWLSGDIILSTGSDMLNIERVGNVVRFTVDVPAVFTCGNETCVQMYWLQDETDINSIRPPISGGKLLGTNTYGDMKVFVFPTNTIANPANPAATLNNKGFYPSFIFQSYNNGTGSNEAELDITLQRNSASVATIGMAFTPGSTGIPQHMTFLGTDTEGSIITYQLSGEKTAGVLGTILYNGATITKRHAIVISYDSTVLTSNLYNVQWWDPQGKQTLGTQFKVINQGSWNLATNSPILDATGNSLLNIGQVVDVFSVQVGSANGVPTYMHYCFEQPAVNAGSLWTTIGAIQFGDTLTSRDGATSVATVDDSRTYDNEWGIDGLHDVTLFNSGTPIALHTAYDAYIDTAIPALTVYENPGTAGEMRRPVTIWNRASMRNAYLELHFARPVIGGLDGSARIVYPPIDIIARAPIDRYDSAVIAGVSSTGTLSGGTYSGAKYAALTGVSYNSIPKRGLTRVVYPSGDYNNTYPYQAVLDNNGSAVLVLVGTSVPSTSDFLEILHEDYEAPAARLQFEFNTGTHDITMQAQVGTINPGVNYPGITPADLAGAMQSGYAVSSLCWQNGSINTGTTGYTSSPAGFVVYNGSRSGGIETFNVLQVLVLEGQLWLWWNGLLLAPSPTLSAGLSTPVDISTPYFPINDAVEYGKFGVRLFPGAKLRRFIVRSQPTPFSQYSLGQLEVGGL